MNTSEALCVAELHNVFPAQQCSVQFEKWIVSCVQAVKCDIRSIQCSVRGALVKCTSAFQFMMSNNVSFSELDTKVFITDCRL